MGKLPARSLVLRIFRAYSSQMANLDEYLSRGRGRQAELVRRLNLGAGTLSSIRSGHRRPSPELARRIEDATDGEVRAAALLGVEEKGAPFNHDTAPQPLSGGRWMAKVAADGSLFLTPEAVAAMGLAPGERLVMRPDGDEVRINSSDKALKAIRNAFRRLVPEGRSVVDELIADRRAEAARE